MKTISITRRQAAQFLVHHHFPSVPHHLQGADAVAHLVNSLGYIQIDPMTTVARNHDLVLHARLPGYRPEDLETCLYNHRTLCETVTTVRCIVPVEDMRFFLQHHHHIKQANKERFTELEPVMNHIKEIIRREGPKCSRDFELDQRMNGWWDPKGEKRTRVVRQALEWMWHGGDLVVTRRKGNLRYFDLPERVLPPQVLGDDHSSHWRRLLAEKYFRCLGLGAPHDFRFGFIRGSTRERKQLLGEMSQDGLLTEVIIHEVPQSYYILSDMLGLIPSEGEARRDPGPASGALLLPPLDNFLWFRQRLEDVFGFSYTWEAYIPRAKRRYGPYTMPLILEGRPLGRIDARTDRAAGRLEVNVAALEEGISLNPGEQEEVRTALLRLGRFVGAERICGDLPDWLSPRPLKA